jgi:hypothetical protein
MKTMSAPLQPGAISTELRRASTVARDVTLSMYDGMATHGSKKCDHLCFTNFKDFNATTSLHGPKYITKNGTKWPNA